MAERRQRQLNLIINYTPLVAGRMAACKIKAQEADAGLCIPMDREGERKVTGEKLPKGLRHGIGGMHGVRHDDCGSPVLEQPFSQKLDRPVCWCLVQPQDGGLQRQLRQG
ncbi:hypothetical protein [Rhizobium sullae]|uniref:hypothetical protein n=1 Tax=Rhizobium sullae TaxID=50338 RepID=UPI0010474D8D|nr:hypothetical protein [Rhizobium sullae]